MGKIYLGEEEIITGGGGGGIPDASFEEVTEVMANALHDLKFTKADISSVPTLSQVNTIASNVSTLSNQLSGKADTSTVYTKKEIDDGDMAAAAALADHENRIIALEGSSFDPTDISAAIDSLEDAVSDVSVKIDDLESGLLDIEETVSDISVNISDIEDAVSDINASVNALESETDDISTLAQNIKNGTQVLKRVIAAENGLTNYQAPSSTKEYYNVVGQAPAQLTVDTGEAGVAFRVGTDEVDALRVWGYKSSDGMFSRKIEYYDRDNSQMKDLAREINSLDASALSFDASIKALDASALAFDASIKELAQGGGGGITPAQLDASLKEYTYDKATIDASFNYVDSSIQALDASCLTFDASIKELAQQGGGGGLSDTDVPFIRIQNSDGSKWCYVPPTMSEENRTKVLNNITTNGAIVKNHYNVAYRYYGGIGLGTANSTRGTNSFAVGYGTKADGTNSVAFGTTGNFSNGALAENSFVQGNSCNVNSQAVNSFAHGNQCICGNVTRSGSYDWGSASHAEGYATKAGASYSHAEGYNTSTGYKVNSYSMIGIASHAEGYYTSAFGDYSHAEGAYTKAFNYVEHAAGYYNMCSSTGGVNYNNFGSELNTLSTIGNGAKDSSRHNAFEVRQSGDIYISDVSAAGEYYEKPMINLQQKIYELEARIAALEGA